MANTETPRTVDATAAELVAALRDIVEFSELPIFRLAISREDDRAQYRAVMAQARALLSRVRS